MGKMPPPGGDSPGLAIMIGVPHGKDGKMPPPGMEDTPQGSGKASREDAGFRGDDERCIDCSNYDPSSGDCSKVEGSMSPQDTCAQYFQPVDDEGEESSAQESSEDDGRGAIQDSI